MTGCCNENDCAFDGMSPAYKRALWAVIAINGTMFLVEMAAGFSSGSQALKADALDFAGDTATYTLTLAVLGMPLIWRARAALFKGLSLASMGLFVLASTVVRFFASSIPQADIMTWVGALALTANLASVLILLRFRNGDSNVRSVWLCSRNDAIGNLAVIGAAGAVWFTGTAWPDLIVAGLMAVLFSWSAWQIVRQALTERRQDMMHSDGASQTVDRTN